MKEYLFETQSLPGSPDHWNDVVAVLICPLKRAGPNDTTGSCNPLWYAHDPYDTGNRGYGYAFQDSHHLIWLFEERFIFNLLQYLMHWLSEHCTDDLSISKP